MKNVLMDILVYAINAPSGENYQPWKVNIDDFYKIIDEHEKLKFLLGFAVLAPSAHNCQPWNFSIKDQSIFIFKNKERSLHHGDTLGRQVLISIGCAIENIIIAADFYGLKTEVHYSLPFSTTEVAQVKFDFSSQKNNGDKNHLIYSIPNRSTNRGKFKKDMLFASFIGKIENLSTQEIKINIVNDSEKIKKGLISDITTVAQIETMNDNDFREELSHYVKHSFTKEKIGMPGFTIGGVPAPASFFLSTLIKKKNMSRFSYKKDIALLKSYTPAFVILSGVKDDQSHCIDAGRLLEKIWLMAEKSDLACAPLAAAIECKNYYKELQEVLKISTKPLAFFRIGYPKKKFLHSPRLNIDDVLIN